MAVWLWGLALKEPGWGPWEGLTGECSALSLGAERPGGSRCSGEMGSPSRALGLQEGMAWQGQQGQCCPLVRVRPLADGRVLALPEEAGGGAATLLGGIPHPPQMDPGLRRCLRPHVGVLAGEGAGLGPGPQPSLGRPHHLRGLLFVPMILVGAASFHGDGIWGQLAGWGPGCWAQPTRAGECSCPGPSFTHWTQESRVPSWVTRPPEEGRGRVFSC